MAEDVYGFDHDRAEILKAIADHPRVINQLNLQRRRPSGGSLRYFWPPPGGIPAASSDTNTLSTNSANCVEAIQDGPDHYVKGTATAKVQNMVSYAVGTNGKPIAAIQNAYGGYTILIENGCDSTTQQASTSFTDPTSQGMINSVSENVSIGA